MGQMTELLDRRDRTGADVEQARDSADEQYSQIGEELADAMRMALSGFRSTVPSWRKNHHGQPIEYESIVADEVSEALCHLAPMHALMMVLKDSACPLVTKLRKAVNDQYVLGTVEGIDEARTA
jgi:hypothetical protein